MPKSGTHTTKRSAVETAVMQLVRKRRDITSTQIHAALPGKITHNAVKRLLKKLTDEGYLSREFEYEDGKNGQPVGAFKYRAA